MEKISVVNEGAIAYARPRFLFQTFVHVQQKLSIPVSKGDRDAQGGLTSAGNTRKRRID